MLVPTATTFPSGENARALTSKCETRSVAASTASSSSVVSFSEATGSRVWASRILTLGCPLCHRAALSTHHDHRRLIVAHGDQLPIGRAGYGAHSHAGSKRDSRSDLTVVVSRCGVAAADIGVVTAACAWLSTPPIASMWPCGVIAKPFHLPPCGSRQFGFRALLSRPLYRRTGWISHRKAPRRSFHRCDTAGRPNSGERMLPFHNARPSVKQAHCTRVGIVVLVEVSLS